MAKVTIGLCRPWHAENIRPGPAIVESGFLLDVQQTTAKANELIVRSAQRNSDRESVAVMFRLIRAFRRHANILRLLPGQFC